MEKLTEIYEAKGYTEFKALEQNYNEHLEFLKHYKADVTISLSDHDFLDSL